jgi:hypothetical protein
MRCSYPYPKGQFYSLPIQDTARLTHLLPQRTIGLFLKLGRITEQFTETLLRGRHSGFSVDNSVHLDGGDHNARQALAQSIARAPLFMDEQGRRSPPWGGRHIHSYGLYSSRCKARWRRLDSIQAR